MAPSKSGKKNSKNWKLNTPLLSKCQKIQNICSYKEKKLSIITRLGQLHSSELRGGGEDK